MNLYKMAKSLNEIKEERAHRNRRLQAAPYIGGGLAAAASVAHDLHKPTGAVQLKMKGGKMIRGTQRQYHLLRQESTHGKVNFLKGSAKRAAPRALLAGAAVGAAGKLYKYVAEERARYQEKARRRELRGDK